MRDVGKIFVTEFETWWRICLCWIGSIPKENLGPYVCKNLYIKGKLLNSETFNDSSSNFEILIDQQFYKEDEQIQL
jgi:hypothetical protein